MIDVSVQTTQRLYFDVYRKIFGNTEAASETSLDDSKDYLEGT